MQSFKTSILISTILCAVIILGLTSPSWGAVPQLINYQGLLKNNLGNPVTDSNYSVTFTIYDQLTNGNNLWSETQGVPTNDGSFSVQLGNSVTLPDDLFDDTVRYIGIKVNPELNEMTPRQRMVSTPYSYRVKTVDGATGGVISGDVSIQSNLSVAGSFNVTSLPGSNITQCVIQGAAGETANLLELQNELGAPLVSVDPDGGMVAKTMALGAIAPGPPQVTPLLIKGTPGRSPLIELIGSDGELAASFDDGGALFSRFGVFAHDVQCSEGLNVGGDFHVSGNSEIGGNDFLVTAVGSQFLNKVGIGAPPSTSSDVLLRVQSGTVVHELGHNLGLYHGGGFTAPPSDDFLQAFDESGNKVASINNQGNFVSLMGYGYQGTGIRLDEGPDPTQDFLQAWDNTGNKRIEFDHQGNMALEGDALIEGHVAIGTPIANCKLHVGGAIATAVTIVSSPTPSITLDESHSIVLCKAVLSPITVNLPTAVGIAGCQYTIKLIFSNITGVFIDPFGSETIEDAATYFLSSQYQYATIVSDGANWWIIANN